MAIPGVDLLARQVGRGHIGDIVAAVAVLRPLGIVRPQATAARLYRQRQITDLCAGIVIVELARHRPAGSGQQATDTVAHGSATAMADMQWPGGVGGHELDLHAAAGTSIAVAKALALGQHALHHRAAALAGQEEVDEARPCNLGTGDQR